MKKIKSLSIVVPVYNEQSRINNLTTIDRHFNTQDFPTEIIVVNDGSTDQTLPKLKILQKQLKLKLISYSQNKGKGYALKTGILSASGSYILFTDIDLSTPLNEFDKFKPFLAEYDILIGTRKEKGAKLLKRQPLLRESLGKIFTLISQKLLGVRVSDFTCGFKCFSRSAAREIFSLLTINRWGFDSEALFIAHKKHFKLKEIPVSWQNDPNSKVKFPQDILNSLRELLIIRKNDFNHHYD